MRRFFCHECHGGALATVAIALPGICGVVGLSVDIGVWYLARRQAQVAVDAAAVDAAYQLQFSSGSLTTAAKRGAAKNGVIIDPAVTIEVNNPPKAGAYVGKANAVEVYLHIPQPGLLSSVIYDGKISVGVRAVGLLQVIGEACIFGLDTMASQTVKVWGNTTVNAAGCVIGSNSNSSSSIGLGGSSVLKAYSLWAHGGIDQGSNASVTLSRAAVSNASSLVDPYASMSISMPGGCKATNKKVTGTETLAPGRYCNGISFGAQAVATLQPGTYYIDKGNFTVNGGAKITCTCPNATDGVTIVLTGSGRNYATATINGGADVTLRAPSGLNDTYRGILFFQDQNAPTNGTNKLNGGALMSLTGALYFPKQALQYNGDNASTSTKCTQIIARTIEITGNSKIDNSGCAAMGVKPIEVQGVALVE